MESLEFYKFIEGLKKVTRFRPFEGLHENVAGHCYSAIMLAYDIMSQYDLNLNKNHVFELLLFHDIPEIGMEYDITAPESANSKDTKAKKKEIETAKAEMASKKFNRPKLKEFYIEFEDKKSREALFANFIDKLDTSIHVLTNKCADFKCNDDYEFILHYIDKYAIHFPQLDKLVQSVKAELNSLYNEFKKRNKA